METRVWFGCIIFNCLLIHYGVAKPFSINKALAEAKLQKQGLSKVSEEEDNTASLKNRLSPIFYKKTFQIKSPLKPKKFSLFRPTLKIGKQRKNKDIPDFDIINRKYVPLLESVSQLFDNLVTSASENTILGRTRLRGNNLNKRRNKLCPCSEPESYVAESNKVEEAIAAPSVKREGTPDKVDITETATETSNTPSTSHFSSLRQNKNIPLLLPRNTPRRWRNYHGLRQRNSAAYNRSTERHISGNNRHDKYNTEHERNETSPKHNETNTGDVARHSSISDGPRGLRSRKNGTEIRNAIFKRPKQIQVKRNRARPREIYRNIRPGASEILEVSETKNSNRDFRRNVDDVQGQDSIKVRRNKKKISTILSKPGGRLRGDLSKIQINSDTKSIQPKESGKESNNNILQDVTGIERITKRSRSFAAKDQEVGETNESVTLLNNFDIPIRKINKGTKFNKQSIKNIFDNGNYFSEKQAVTKKYEKTLQNSSNLERVGDLVILEEDNKGNISFPEHKIEQDRRIQQKLTDEVNTNSEDEINDKSKIYNASEAAKYETHNKLKIINDAANVRVNRSHKVNEKYNKATENITTEIKNNYKHKYLKDNVKEQVTESNIIFTTTTISNLDYDDTTESLNLDLKESSEMSQSEDMITQETKQTENKTLLHNETKGNADRAQQVKDYDELKINLNTNNSKETDNVTYNTEDLIKGTSANKVESLQTKDRYNLFNDLANAKVHRGDKDGSQKLLMIIDGYSIARDKYGEKRLAKKSIHVIS